jgi:hypothetical protein
MRKRIVEDFTHRRKILAHHTLHAVDGADHVALVDHVAAAHADKQVLRMVRHADDLVRHDLADGEDQIIAGVHDAAIDLDRNGIAPEPLGDLAQIAARDLAQLFNVGAPVMNEKPTVRNVAEHCGGLLLRYGGVGAERGENVHRAAAFGERMVIDVRDKTRIGKKPREIRRDQQHTAQRSAFE